MTNNLARGVDVAQGIKSFGPCSVPTCEQDARTRGWCRYHYLRWYKHGDPEAPVKRWRLGDPNRPACRVESCNEPFLHSGLCQRHGHAAWRNGSPEKLRYEWAEPSACKVCAAPPGGRFRQFCSFACWNAWRNYDGDVPLGKACVSCGVQIDFLSTDSAGRKTFRARSWCANCKGRYRSHHLNVVQLSIRDGDRCALCALPVDMTLSRRESLMCPSVDHRVPIARGGSDEPENLQLAHLLCNIRKGARYLALPKGASP